MVAFQKNRHVIKLSGDSRRGARQHKGPKWVMSFQPQPPPAFPRASSTLFCWSIVVEENHVDGTQDCPDRYVSSMVVRYRAGRSDWRSGGTVSWRRRRRIGFSSRTLPTDGAEILRRWWLAGLVHATARCLAGMRKRCPVPSGYMCIYSVLLETATHLVLVFRFVLFFISANPPVLLPFFHPPINNRRTPCLRQHCRCQRCRQDHPGHWCRCRRSGEFN